MQTTSVCNFGHELTKDNSFNYARDGRRGCIACRKALKARSWDKIIFGGNREKAIQRDGCKCVKCGMTRDQHKAKFGRDITVDHIDNNGTYKPAHLRNNTLENLQTLCIRCHASKDNRQNKMTLEQAVNVRHMRNELSKVQIAKLYGVSGQYITQIIKGDWHKTEASNHE